jgi:hypothetical protein
VYFRDFYRKLTLDSWSFNASSLHFLGLFYSQKTLQCVSNRAPLKFLHVSADSLAHAAHDDLLLSLRLRILSILHFMSLIQILHVDLSHLSEHLVYQLQAHRPQIQYHLRTICE